MSKQTVLTIVSTSSLPLETLANSMRCGVDARRKSLIRIRLEWLGAEPEREEEEQTSSIPAPAGFLAAIYRAGESRDVILQLDPEELPKDWAVYAAGRDPQELLTSEAWTVGGQKPLVELAWSPVQPPERLLVRWTAMRLFLPSTWRIAASYRHRRNWIR